MTTATAPKDMERWGIIVPRFASEIYGKYPSLQNGWTETLLAEIKALGLAAEYISSKSLWAAFRNCVAEGTIVLPAQPKVDVAEASERLAAAFPSVMTERQLRKQKQDAAANAGIAKQTGYRTSADRQADSAKISRDVATAKSLSRLAELRTEYRALKVKAETAMGNNPRNHAETQSVRKAALAKLNLDLRFAEVRES